MNDVLLREHRVILALETLVIEPKSWFAKIMASIPCDLVQIRKATEPRRILLSSEALAFTIHLGYQYLHVRHTVPPRVCLRWTWVLGTEYAVYTVLMIISHSASTAIFDHSEMDRISHVFDPKLKLLVRNSARFSIAWGCCTR